MTTAKKAREFHRHMLAGLPISGVLEDPVEEVCHCGDTYSQHDMYSGHTFTPIPASQQALPEALQNRPTDYAMGVDWGQDETVREVAERMGTDWETASREIERLSKAAQRTGEAFVTLGQTAEEERLADLLELTVAEKREADTWEDVIEETLDLLANAGKDMIEVPLFHPGKSQQGDRIQKYLRDRYRGWTIRTRAESPVWEFHAR